MHKPVRDEHETSQRKRGQTDTLDAMRLKRLLMRWREAERCLYHEDAR